MRIVFEQVILWNDYQIVDGFICPHAVVNKISPTERLDVPKRFPALFREFAQIETEGDVLTFANRCGLLGIFVSEGKKYQEYYWQHFETGYTPKRQLPIQFGKPEPVELWQILARKMRLLLQIFDARTLKDARTAIDRYLIADLRASTHPKQTFMPDFSINEDIASPKLRKEFVTEIVNQNCQGCVSLVFTGDGKWELHPHDLLAAMWVQFAQELSGELELRRCKNPKCPFGSWFEIGLEARRRHSRYCSRECRNAVNNAKRPKTRQGRKASKSLKPTSKRGS